MQICLFAETGAPVSVLIQDTGYGKKELLSALEKYGLDPGRISAVFLRTDIYIGKDEVPLVNGTLG